jgi:AcrR family transcriptional regulator
MREWVPVSTSAKGRLTLAAVRAFGAQPFDAVSVADLAAEADVTTGALYHHFGSKLGLYEFVRRDVEQRLLDRMEGAAASVGNDSITKALAVGFDFAVQKGFQRILGEPPQAAESDALVDLLDALVAPAAPPLGRMLATAWRAAVLATCDGGDVDAARAALSALRLRTGG